MGRNAQIYVRDDAGPGAPTLLPKAVRLLRPAPRGAAPGAMCEFEVVSGNAAYQKGEHFYLTPAQARRAYFTANS